MPLKELYSKSFQLLKNNPSLVIPFFFASLLAVPGQYITKGTPEFYIFAIVSVILGLVIACGTVSMAGKAVSSGKATFNDFTEALGKHFFRYILMNLIILGAMLIPIALFIVLAIGATVALGSATSSVAAFVLLIPLGLAVFVGLIGISFSTQLLIISNETPTNSLKKSFTFVKSNLWDILVMWFSMIALSIVVSIPVIIIAFVNPTPVIGAVVGIIMSPLSAFTNLLVVAFYVEKKG